MRLPGGSEAENARTLGPVNRRVPPLAALVLVGLMAAGCARTAGEPFQVAHTDTLPVDGRTGQSFSPRSTRLAGVDVLTGTLDEEPSGTLVMRLRDGVGGPVLARAEVDGTDVGDNSWTRFRFDVPIQAPAVAAATFALDGGGTVVLYADVPDEDTTPGEIERGEVLGNDPYPGGALLDGDTELTGDLAFRVVGADGPGAVGGALGGVLANAGRLLGQVPLFTAAWVALLAAAVGLAAVGLRRPGRDADRGLDRDGPAIDAGSDPVVTELAQGGEDQQRGGDDERRPQQALELGAKGP